MSNSKENSGSCTCGKIWAGGAGMSGVADRLTTYGGAGISGVLAFLGGTD